ncbi:MAG: beta-ketoacyl synthase [Flavobacteriales bacterium]|nr:beta-ketoacyl synthase [Flavobacteriales bacterium]
MRVPVWIGAARCVSALGEGAAAHVARMRTGGTALREHPGPASKPMVMGRIPEELLPDGPDRIHRLMDRCLAPLLDEVRPKPDERWLLVIATAKGDIHAMEQGDAAASAIPLLAEHIRQRCGIAHPPLTISLACASGTAALIAACTAIEQGHADHAIVLAADALSRFVLDGFAALFALDPGPCHPFDAARKGTTLGEACAAVAVSRDRSRMPRMLGRWRAGAIAHDANHISGPSRTGEGLLRAVRSAMRQAAVQPSDIAVVNAHGTGTDYNDAMESIAFERSGLGDVPISGYKGWFGHTLGAAGLLETVIALEALREGTALRTEGFSTTNVPGRVHVLTNDQQVRGNLLLKTSSGFGGANAAVLIEAASA